jgi:hypothetical protein
MQKLLIIIPGAKLKRSNFKLVNIILNKFYKYLKMDVQEINEEWASNLKQYIEAKTDFKVEVFSWSGGISNKSVKLAAEQLKEFIISLSNVEITIFAKSMGGILGEELLKDSFCRQMIKKFIYVASPHRNIPSEEIEIFNIYSKVNRCIKLAQLTLFRGNHFKLGGAQNVELSNLCHDDFNKNIPIKYKYKNKNMNLFNLYKYIATSQL